MRTAPHVVLVVLLLVGSVGPGNREVTAQPFRSFPSSRPGGQTERSLDERLLRSIYAVDAPIFRITMRAADVSAYPVFIGAPLAAWGGAWLVRGGGDWADAYRLTVSQAATYGTVVSLKGLIRRPRPYAVLPDIQSRSERYSPLGPEGDSFAFPSGHAAMSFAIATSWSLSHPQWYVIGPGLVWASAVSLSRVWLGVHYPSDVLAGAFIGTTLAVGVHLIGASITPDRLKDDESAITAPVIQIQIRL